MVYWAGKMAQQVTTALAARHEDLSLTPGSHMVEGEKQPLKVVLWTPHVHCGTHSTHKHTYLYTISK